MKLIVGLGNPGKEYENTRHNIGFMVIDKYLERNNLKLDKEKFNGKYIKTTINEEEVIFLEPQTFMNSSGICIQKIMNFYKINYNDILVIHDDLDLELGKIKIKENSTSGGHNGIKSIEECLNTHNYKRIKIGISNDKTRDTKDYVLGKFTKEENKILDETILKCIDIINDFFVLNFDMLQGKYNKR